MRTAYFDGFAGAAGDMIVASLLDAGASLPALRRGLASLRLKGVSVRAWKTRTGEFRATRFDVAVPAHEQPRDLHDLERIVRRAPLAARVQQRAVAVFRRLAAAEARVHGIPIERIHFHEVGASDAIADVVGAALALEDLGVERLAASPLRLGSGTTGSAHGPLPIPAPGTAELLRGATVRLGGRAGERTTPTGAAILSALADSIGEEVAMRVDRIGYGAGSRDFGDGPNVLRVLVGEAEDGGGEDAVDVLETNLDDVSGQVVGHALERLLEAGALDAFVTPVWMKKNRPGVVLAALVAPARRAAVEAALFRETGTLGVRRHRVARTILARRPVTLATRFGRVRFKEASAADGRARLRVEYDEAARLARRLRISLVEASERLDAEAARLYRPNASSVSEKRLSPSRTRGGSRPKPTRT